MLFNGEQIMTAGEIRRPAIGPITESANQSGHRVLAALGEAAAAVAIHDAQDDYAVTDVVNVLAEDTEVSPRTRAAVERLLQRHRLQAEELTRQRALLQEIGRAHV